MTTATSSVSVEMPKYQSHKTVWALKIKQVDDLKKAGGRLHFEEEPYAPRQVSEEYMEKHKPVEGGYFVVYEDGYESFSPAAAFEKGNTRL